MTNSAGQRVMPKLNPEQEESVRRLLSAPSLSNDFAIFLAWLGQGRELARDLLEGSSAERDIYRGVSIAMKDIADQVARVGAAPR